jgi:hypothetical protein
MVVAVAATIRIYGKLCTVVAHGGSVTWSCPSSADLQTEVQRHPVNDEWREQDLGSSAIPNWELRLAQRMAEAHGGEVVTFDPVASEPGVVY